jgi:hypothetical protein
MAGEKRLSPREVHEAFLQPFGFRAPRYSILTAALLAALRTGPPSPRKKARSAVTTHRVRCWDGVRISHRVRPRLQGLAAAAGSAPFPVSDYSRRRGRCRSDRRSMGGQQIAKGRALLSRLGKAWRAAGPSATSRCSRTQAGPRRFPTSPASRSARRQRAPSMNGTRTPARRYLRTGLVSTVLAILTKRAVPLLRCQLLLSRLAKAKCQQA